MAGACSCRLALSIATAPYVLITCGEALPVVVIVVVVVCLFVCLF